MNEASATTLREVLDEALEDEYRARAIYRAVLDKFGDVRPFSNIVESEGRHIEALRGLYARRGLEPIEDRWEGRVEAPASLEQACRDALQAEIDNGAMYERLLARVDDPEAAGVLRRLRDASTERHLPAFRRCAERGAGGRGRRGR